jgi:hypothetical protein
MNVNTTDMNCNVSYNESEINFEGLFKNRPLKFVGITSAAFSMLILFVVCYGIIWFERFGSGNSIYQLLLL